MGFSKSLDSVLSEALLTLTERTGITNISDDSISRLLLELPLREITNALDLLDERDKQFKLTSADTLGLDWLGDLLGIDRKTNTVGRSSQVGMKFYLDAPAQENILIPEGTTVWDPTSAVNIFYTTSPATIIQGTSYTLTGITSPYAGAASASIGVLTAHSGSGIIKCVNLEAISGTSEEGNDQYKYRLMDARLGRNALLRDAIRTKLLSHPSVLDCKILPRKRGNGTIDVVVYTAESIPRKETIDNIYDFMLKCVADGISIKIYAPTPVILDVTVRISVVQRNSSALGIDQIRHIAQTNIINYINSLNLGESLYPDDIDRIILNVSDNIVDMSITEMYTEGNLVPVDTVTVGSMQRLIAGRVVVI